MRTLMRTILAAGGAAAVLLLAGCATSTHWVVENDVQTFSQLSAVPVPATYRFERLPSQQASAQEQARIEAAAEPALAKAGWVRDEAAPRYSVQVDSGVQASTQVVDPWLYGRFGPWGPYGRPFGPYGWGPYWGYPYGMWDQSYVLREVSVVIRELSNQRVVYETRALHESRWPSDPAVLAPMFDAALSSFPQPPAGVRRVNITVPRAGAQ
ncbi:DUF4136 domain-containing protein [Pseudorhodoferax sp.]|uniref:DUF4136 domain-containing protein n=1 Tax=Pseudorhodoferax sp. TaxID=1993553 RepID=UPI0039E5EF25